MQQSFVKQIYQKGPFARKIMVFLDRDGTINRDISLLTDQNQVHIFQSTAPAIRIFNALKVPVVIVTNQPVIARGLITAQKAMQINDFLYSTLRKKRAYISAIYACPHHPNANLAAYRDHCQCRKPGGLLLQKAAKNFNIGLDNDSYIIGDQTVDIQTGKTLGLTTILVKTGHCGKDKKYQVEPDFICQTIYQAAKLIQSKLRNI